jgi:2-aminobenzoate-CoA ligase
MTSPVDSYVTDRLPPAALQPEFRFDLPELHYPERLNGAAALLAGKDPETLAVLSAHGRWNYGELDALSSRIARALVEQESLVPGNRVYLAGANGAMVIACWLGVLKAGGVVVAGMPILRAGEIAKLLDRAAVSHALVETGCRAAFDEAARALPHIRSVRYFGPDSAPNAFPDDRGALRSGFPAADTGRDDPAIIAFTSGTTGVPKGCVHFHRDVLASADTFARHILEPEPGWRWACTAPLAFTFGLGMQFLFPFRFGGTAVIPERPGPEGLLETIARFGVQVCATAPTAYRAMLSQLPGHDVSSLEVCVSASEHLPAATWHAWREATGIGIVDGIGATEMMHIFVSASGDDIRPGATGRAVPGYEATVLDEAGNPLEQGVGRLAVKGPTGCRYLDDPRQADYVQNGWNVTGDTYRRDADGYFWYVARSDDIIVSAGYNIAAPEVEEALASHSAVAECAVVGVPCEERGSKVKAFVVLAPGQAAAPDLADRLKAHVKATIAPYKYPREIAFVDSLPRTQTGKLRRVALRELSAQGAGGPESSASAPSAR